MKILANERLKRHHLRAYDLDDPSGMFGRMRRDGNVDILYMDDGDRVTSIDTPAGISIYPVGSNKSTKYEHPEGIVLTLSDARKLKLKIER